MIIIQKIPEEAGAVWIQQYFFWKYLLPEQVLFLQSLSAGYSFGGKHVVIDWKCCGAEEPSVDISFKSGRPNSILCRYKQGLIQYCGGPFGSEHECLTFLLHVSWIWELIILEGFFAFLSNTYFYTEMSLPTMKPRCTSCFMKQTGQVCLVFQRANSQRQWTIYTGG